jgi:hypothetical protein
MVGRKATGGLANSCVQASISLAMRSRTKRRLRALPKWPNERDIKSTVYQTTWCGTSTQRKSLGMNEHGERAFYLLGGNRSTVGESGKIIGRGLDFSLSLSLWYNRRHEAGSTPSQVLHWVFCEGPCKGGQALDDSAVLILFLIAYDEVWAYIGVRLGLLERFLLSLTPCNACR